MKNMRAYCSNYTINFIQLELHILFQKIIPIFHFLIQSSMPCGHCIPGTCGSVGIMPHRNSALATHVTP